MGTVRGNDGLVAIGGHVPDPIFVQGAVGNGATAATFDDNAGSGAEGVLVAGDTFTVAGDGQTYTIITGGHFGQSVDDELDVTFSPGVVPGGGWVDNSAVTVVLVQLLQVRAFEFGNDRDLFDDTVMRDLARTFKVGQEEFTGTISCLADGADAEQATFIQNVVGGSSPEFAITLTAEDGTHFYGNVVATKASHRQDVGSIVELELAFAGRGQLQVNF